MPNSFLTLSERIKCARKFARLSQEGIRIAVGAGKGMGQKWELAETDKSYRKPSDETMMAIASVCGVRLEWLMDGTGTMEDPTRVAWGKRIAEAIQSIGGAGIAGPKMELPAETLHRWMRVGPATIAETIELENGFHRSGTPEHIAKMALNSRSDDIRLTQIIRTDTQPARIPHVRKDEAWVSIPVYTAKAAAGSGYQNGHDEVSGDIRMSPEHIRQVLRVPPEALAVLHVVGDSMTPILHPGDAIFIDTRSPGLVTDGIYLIRQDDALMVKQVQRLPGGAIQVSSRNPAYIPYTITQENEKGFDIIGRVVGKYGRI